MLLRTKGIWLAGLVLLAALPFIALKLLSLTAKKPERAANPNTLAPCPDSPNCVCSEEPRDSHSIAPLKFTGDADQAWSRLRSVLQELGGEEIRAGETYLWSEFRTPLIGFVDDLECRLNTAQQQIEIRSASRVGHSDLGANRKRTEAIRAAFRLGGEASDSPNGSSKS